MTQTRLIVFAGRPGTGKTTIARALAPSVGAVPLRIDSFEDGLRASALSVDDVMDAGYAAAREVAADILAARQSVVIDAVNPDEESRQGWDALAEFAGVGIQWVFVRCSDKAMQRALIDERRASGQRRGAI